MFHLNWRINQTFYRLERNIAHLLRSVGIFNTQSAQSLTELNLTEQHVNLLLAIPNMKFVTVAFYVAFVLAIGVDSASVSLSNSQLTLNGNAHIQFYGPREEIWAGLSNGKIYDLVSFVQNPH